MKLKCITIDDEPLALEKIRNYIERIPYLELLQEFDNAVEALNFLKDHQVDLMFLDIQMEELTGIQMLEVMTHQPKVIFTTAYSQYAIKSYELDVCDYLLKPISFQRFLNACEKASHQINPQMPVKISNPSNSNENHDKFIFVKNGQVVQKLDLEDIYFIEGMKDYVRIWKKDEKIMTLLTFKKLQEILPEAKFIRIHKSYIVALDKIELIDRNHIIILKERIPVGRNFQKEFFKIIERKRIN